jgi:hypothetical protein
VGLFPVVLFLATLLAVAETVERYEALASLLGGVLATVGVLVCLYVTIRLVIEFDQFIDGSGPHQLLLPLWLTAGTLPFVAALGTYSTYNTAFHHIKRAAKDDRDSMWLAALALVSGLHVRGRRVGAFNGPWATRLVAASSLSEASSVVRRFRAQGSANPYAA